MSLEHSRVPAEGDASPAYTNAQQPTPEAEHLGPKLKFVFWEHTPENAAAAAENVSDCDIIAMEMVGLVDAHEKQQFEQAATVLLSSSATPEEHRKAERYVRKINQGEHTALLNELKGSNKSVLTLDVGRDDPEYKLHRRSEREQVGLQNALNSDTSNQTIKKQASRMHRADAAAYAAREAKVVTQLLELTARPELTRAKIGVLLGAVHTSVYHEMSRLQKMERVFVGGQQGREKFHFNIYQDIDRRLRFFPEVKVPETLLDRAVIASTYASYDVDSKINNDDGSHDDIAEKMTEAEVEEFLVALDAIKANHIRRLNLIPGQGTSTKVPTLLRKNYDKVVGK